MAQRLSLSQRKTYFINVMILILGISISACDANTSLNGTSFGTSSTSSGSESTSIGPGTQGVQVFVEPTASESVITSAIDEAKQSIWLEIYLLTDTKVIRALED